MPIIKTINMTKIIENHNLIIFLNIMKHQENIIWNFDDSFDLIFNHAVNERLHITGENNDSFVCILDCVVLPAHLKE